MWPAIFGNLLTTVPHILEIVKYHWWCYSFSFGSRGQSGCYMDIGITMDGTASKSTSSKTSFGSIRCLQAFHMFLRMCFVKLRSGRIPQLRLMVRFCNHTSSAAWWPRHFNPLTLPSPSRGEG